jgi:hypothetical protein
MSVKQKKDKSVDEFKGAIRAKPYRVVRIETDHGEPYTLLTEVSEEIQRVKNVWIFAWQRWHFARKSARKLSDWMREYREAAKAKKKPLPKCPVEFMSNEAASWIWREVSRECGATHSRCRTLAIQREQKDLGKRNAATGGFKRWHRILCGYGELPQWSRPQPIPIDTHNCTLEARDVPDPRKPGKTLVEWSLVVRVDCFVGKGKSRGESHQLRLILRTGGRGGPGLTRILERCKSGEWKFCGSSLFPKDGSWYVALCYRERKATPAKVDPGKTAVVCASRKRSFRIRIDGRTIGVRPYGNLVGRIRRQVGDRRRTSNESSRYGSQSRLGHGRKRAAPDLKNIEDCFKKTFNEQSTADMVGLLVARGVGRIVFRQPKPRMAGTRFLVTAGSPSGRPGTWPWHQVEEMLRRKTARLGIELVTTCEKSKTKTAAKPITARGKKE